MLRLTVATFLFLTLFATMARAEEPQNITCPKTIRRAKRAQRVAGKWFAKGEQAAAESRFQEAIEDFLCSLHIYPHQNTVFNVAQLTNLVQDKALAAASIKKFREEHPTSEFDDELSDLIASLEGVPEPEETIEEAPPEPAPPPPPQEIPDATLSENEESASKINVLRISGFVGIATAGATLAVGIALQALSGEARNDAESSSDYEMFKENESKRKSRQSGATAMYIATGVLAGAGTALIIFDRRKRETESDSQFGAALSVAPGALGMAITGRF